VLTETRTGGCGGIGADALWLNAVAVDQATRPATHRKLPVTIMRWRGGKLTRVIGIAHFHGDPDSPFGNR
jgi:hypothetical protein